MPSLFQDTESREAAENLQQRLRDPQQTMTPEWASVLRSYVSELVGALTVEVSADRRRFRPRVPETTEEVVCVSKLHATAAVLCRLHDGQSLTPNDRAVLDDLAGLLKRDLDDLASTLPAETSNTTAETSKQHGAGSRQRVLLKDDYSGIQIDDDWHTLTEYQGESLRRLLEAGGKWLGRRDVLPPDAGRRMSDVWRCKGGMHPAWLTALEVEGSGHSARYRVRQPVALVP